MLSDFGHNFGECAVDPYNCFDNHMIVNSKLRRLKEAFLMSRKQVRINRPNGGMQGSSQLEGRYLVPVSMNRALYAALLCLALVTVQRRSIADGRQLGAGGSSSVKCPGAALVSVQDGLSSTVVEEPCQDETVSTTDSLDDMIRMGVKDDSSSGAKNVKGGHVLQSAQTTPNKNISAAVGQIGTGR